MNNKWLLIILLIALVAFGGYYLYAKKVSQPATHYPSSSPTTSPTEVMHEQAAITLTKDGFSPASLTVKAGTTVTWTNKSGAKATVNSDPHPTHTAYPPLNLGMFADGETLSLTFDKPGTYGYHNHLNPNDRGTIIVQ